MRVPRLLFLSAGALLLAACGQVSPKLETLASKIEEPVPTSVIVSYNGLEWVYASPCAEGGCSADISVGKDGFGFATEAQWAQRPPVEAFQEKCASPWLDTKYDHCDFGDLNEGRYGSAPVGGLPTATGEPMQYSSDTLLVRSPTELPEPETDLYTIDAEGLSSSRMLYGVRAGQGMTGPANPGRVSVGGKRVINGKFRGGQSAKVLDIWGGKRMTVVANNKSTTPNTGGGQLQFVFNPFFTKDLVTVKEVTLYNVVEPGVTVNLYKGRTLVKQVSVPTGAAGKAVKVSLDEPGVSIVSITARFPVAVDDLVFEVAKQLR